ncbi:MAG: CGGC domain-containing protein [Desulfovibrionaceae bacterium]
MTKVAILRCPENAMRCPLTSCFRCLTGCAQGFARYGQAEPAGVFTLPATLDETVALARILQAKGAEAIHAVTCAFAHKQDGAWVLGGGFTPDLDDRLRAAAAATGLPCVKGTAHLPAGYEPETF